MCALQLPSHCLAACQACWRSAAIGTPPGTWHIVLAAQKIWVLWALQQGQGFPQARLLPHVPCSQPQRRAHATGCQARLLPHSTRAAVHSPAGGPSAQAWPWTARLTGASGGSGRGQLGSSPGASKAKEACVAARSQPPAGAHAGRQACRVARTACQTAQPLHPSQAGLAVGPCRPGRASCPTGFSCRHCARLLGSMALQGRVRSLVFGEVAALLAGEAGGDAGALLALKSPEPCTRPAHVTTTTAPPYASSVKVEAGLPWACTCPGRSSRLRQGKWGSCTQPT